MRAIFLAAVILLALAGSACMRWQSAPLPAPREPGDTLELGNARITTRPGMQASPLLPRRMVLRYVRVHGDSLIGWGGPTLAESRQRIAVHRDQVVGIEYGGIDWWRTGGAAVLSVLALYGAAIVYVLAMYGVGG